MERPSRYHVWVYTGGVNEREWRWDSSHEDLEPTSTFGIGYQHYCSYCCNKAYPIQAGLREKSSPYIDRDYTTTGYCCTCESAEQEKEMRSELKQLKDKHKREEREVNNKYSDVLKHDKKKRLEMVHRYEMKQIEESEHSFDFDRR